MSAKMVNPWALHRVAAARKAAGEKVVLLGMGEPDTPSHPAALKALTAAVAAGEEGYAPALGLPELRAAIAERIGIGGSPDAVHITCGGQTALYLAVATLCQRFKDRHGSSTKYVASGDGPPLVLTPTPTYATYEHTVALAGGGLLLAPQPVEDDFKISVSSLASALSSHQGQVAAVLITNPHNPTGHLLTRDELAPLGALCEQHDLYLVVDEVYGPLVYDTSPEARAFTSCAAVPGLSQRAIGLGSFSKIGLRPGWRVGWMAVPPDLEAEVQSLSEATLFGISPITQRAALAVMPLLEPGNSEASRYGARLAALLRGLEGGTGVVRAILPEAGMFALVDVAPVDGLTFGEQLLEEYGFSVLPGEAFGSELRSFIRVGLLAEPAEMEAAGRAIVACARSMSAVATNDDDAGTSDGEKAGHVSAGKDELDGGSAAVICGGVMNVGWARDIAANLSAAAPSANISVWTATDAAEGARGVMSEAEAVFVFDPPPGLWTGATSTNLRFVCGMAIGTDHFRSAQSPLPEGVVVGRLLDPLAPQRMGHYVVHAVLGLALGAPEFARQQAAGQWDPTATSVPKDPQDVTVGVLGFGACGSAVASALLRTGFRVRAWSRSPRQATPAGCTLFSGDSNLEPFLREVEVLVVVLPLKTGTEGLLDGRKLRLLPRGAAVVNCGRAEVIVQDDLLRLLDDGQLSEAVLDVTSPEPPPKGSPLWSHPRVRLSPHIAGRMTTTACCQVLLDDWRRIRRGEPPSHPLDPSDL